MAESRAEIVAWVASHIIPHEAGLRQRLRSMAVSVDEIDDIVQDTYVAISQLGGVSHIRNGKAYLYAAARTIVLQRIRRSRIVAIDSLTESQALAIEDEAPSPEQHAAARRELDRVRKLINQLPTLCREIFELRRIQGISQRQIAEKLGIAEHSVEQQATRGLKLIMKAVAETEGDSAATFRKYEMREKDGHG